MAIIGRFPEILEFFAKSHKPDVILEYFTEAMKVDSITGQRIFSLPVGTFQRQEIREGYFAIEQKFLSKDRSECFIESHLKHIDIQLMIDGEELMECVHLSRLSLREDFTEDRDLLTYQDTTDTHKILLRAGDVAVFFPEDGHIGTQTYKKPVQCVKTVVKMPVNFFRL